MLRICCVFLAILCQDRSWNGDGATDRYRIVPFRYRPQQLRFVSKTERREYRDSLDWPITSLLGVLVPCTEATHRHHTIKEVSKQSKLSHNSKVRNV